MGGWLEPKSLASDRVGGVAAHQDSHLNKGNITVPENRTIREGWLPVS